jgi:hypothetical protein
MTAIHKLKCPNWIKPRYTPTGLRRCDKRGSTLRYDYAAIREAPVPHGFQRCRGDLTVEVVASQTPEWGGMSAELELNINCSVCGTAYLQPTNVTTEDWVASLVAAALSATAEEYRR